MPVGSQHGVLEAASQLVDPEDQGPAGPPAANQAPAGPLAGAGDQGGGGNGGNGGPPGPLDPQGPPDPQGNVPPPPPPRPGGPGGGGGGGGGGGPPVPPPAPGPIPGPGRRPPPARAPDPPNALEVLFTSTLVGLNDALNRYANQPSAPCVIYTSPRTAQKWYKPNLYNPTPGTVLAWDGNFLLFVKELTDNFGPQDLMKSSDRIATYIVALYHLAAITGWGDRALWHQFYEGLPNRIKDEMVHHTYINNLPSNKEVACRIDARYWQRKLEKQRERACHPPGNPVAGQGARGSGNPSGSNRSNKGPSGKLTTQPNPSGQKGSGKQSRGNPKDQSGTGNCNVEPGSSQKKAKPYADKLGKDGKLKPEGTQTTSKGRSLLVLWRFWTHYRQLQEAEQSSGFFWEYIWQGRYHYTSTCGG
ncbi:Retrotrans-gag domain-containing protein [Mycena venus]|uniref:Retrotrans-gag domain-containing protein n=1 Tax=Mycena venus TaxID=2733690 RepID=A0A8H6XSW0_9AGAR|nr:Retrotrans-gag domain-containing protein [Mycena venus]